MSREIITHVIEEPNAVSDQELREILKGLLYHLGLDAVRYGGDGAASDFTHIELERSE